MDSSSDNSGNQFCTDQFCFVRRKPCRPDTDQHGAANTPSMVALSPDPPMSEDAQSQPRLRTNPQVAHAVVAPMAMERRSPDAPPGFESGSGARRRGRQPTRCRALPLRPPYTVESIFDNYSKRRGALISALTQDEEAFFQKCDPGMQPLHLYGGTDGNWEVKPPEVELPAPEPEPTPGINLVRDTMERHKWLQRVAVQCDAWLMKTAGLAASYMTTTERGQLFAMIIDLPQIQEIIEEKREVHNVEEERSSGPDEANEVVEEQEVYLIEEKRSSGPTEANEVLEEEDDATNDDNNFCASCLSRYKANSFWICCDECGKWYHGKCVNITSSEAEHKEHYECPDCYHDRVGWS